MSTEDSPSPCKFNSAEKRAVHNALERKRRDHIKDMFTQLKESVPHAAGEKSLPTKASRAQILKKACEYIQMMRRRNFSSAKELEELSQQIDRTKRQIAKLEAIKATRRYVEGLPSQDGVWPGLTTSMTSIDNQTVTGLQLPPSLSSMPTSSFPSFDASVFKAGYLSSPDRRGNDHTSTEPNASMASMSTSGEAATTTRLAYFSTEASSYYQLPVSIPIPLASSGLTVSSANSSRQLASLSANASSSVSVNLARLTATCVPSEVSLYDMHTPDNAVFHVASPFVEVDQGLSNVNGAGWSVQQLLANSVASTLSLHPSQPPAATEEPQSH